LRKKLIKVSPGSVIKALQVVSVDYEDSKPDTLLAQIKNLVCCNFGKKEVRKSHPCIELKLVETIDELSYTERVVNITAASEASTAAESDYDPGIEYGPDEKSLPRARPTETTYYLPLNEAGDAGNANIDLIPISLLFLQQRQHMLETNSLHLMKNFTLDEQLIEENFLELKLVDENPFKGKNFYSTQSGTKFTNSAFSFASGVDEAASKLLLMREDQHLELSKYKSIFDIVDFKSSCQLLTGFSLKTNQFFMIPIEPVRKLSIPDARCLYQKVGPEDADQNQCILRFKATHLDKFLRLAENEMENFGQKLHKIHTSMADAGRIANSAELRLIRKDVTKLVRESSNNEPPNVITHFADLANEAVLDGVVIGDSRVSRSNCVVSMQRRVTAPDTEAIGGNRRRAPKYSTLPCRSGSACVEPSINFVDVEIEQHTEDEDDENEESGSGQGSTREIISRLQLRTNVRSSSMPNKVARQLKESSRVLRNSGKKI
jgi:hypothetical protein